MISDFDAEKWADGVAFRLQDALSRGYASDIRSISVDDLVAAIQIIRDCSRALADTERFEGLARLANGRDWQIISGGKVIGCGPIRYAVDQALLS